MDKHVLGFDLATLTFDSAYPERLECVVDREEFEDVVARINDEFAHDIQENDRKIKKWLVIVGVSLLLFVGVFLIPVPWSRVNKQRRLLAEFYDRVREYLSRINRQCRDRHLEWRLSRVRSIEPGANVVLPEAQLVLELRYRPDVARHRREPDGASLYYYEDASFAKG